MGSNLNLNLINSDLPSGEVDLEPVDSRFFFGESGPVLTLLFSHHTTLNTSRKLLFNTSLKKSVFFPKKNKNGPENKKFTTFLTPKFFFENALEYQKKIKIQGASFDLL